MRGMEIQDIQEVRDEPAAASGSTSSSGYELPDRPVREEVITPGRLDADGDVSYSSVNKGSLSDLFSFSETGISHHEIPNCEACNNGTYRLPCKRCGVRLCAVCVVNGQLCLCGDFIAPGADEKDNAVYSAYEYHEEDKIPMTSVRGKQRLGLVVDLGA